MTENSRGMSPHFSSSPSSSSSDPTTSPISFAADEQTQEEAPPMQISKLHVQPIEGDKELEDSGCPPFSFATDCLGSFEAVKKRNGRSIRLCEGLMNMIKQRAYVEGEYAKQLQRIGNQAANYINSQDTEDRKCEASTFRDCIEHLRVDLVNKAVQHQQLAQNLLTDINDPIQQIYHQLITQSKDLEDRASALAKESHVLDAKYRQSHKKFEHAYQQAATFCSHIIDHGGTPPKVDPQVVYKKHGLAKLSRGNSSISFSSSSEDQQQQPPTKRESELRRMSLTPTTAASLITQVARADLTSWLLPTEKERSQKLLLSTRDYLEMAELCRYNCRDRYEDLVLHAKQATHHLQLMLSDYQMLEERCIDEIQVILRKHVVFESSCLANEQYEAQVIFKVIEAVDKDQDLEAFIRSSRTPCSGMDAFNILKNFAVSFVPLPIPPPPLGSEQIVSDPSVIDPQYPVITSSDLPNLSSPAPSVVPASSVLRLLLVSRAPSPSLLRASPSPASVPLPDTSVTAAGGEGGGRADESLSLDKIGHGSSSSTDINKIGEEETEVLAAIPLEDGGVEYAL